MLVADGVELSLTITNGNVESMVMRSWEQVVVVVSMVVGANVGASWHEGREAMTMQAHESIIVGLRFSKLHCGQKKTSEFVPPFILVRLLIFLVLLCLWRVWLGPPRISIALFPLSRVVGGSDKTASAKSATDVFRSLGSSNSVSEPCYPCISRMSRLVGESNQTALAHSATIMSRSWVSGSLDTTKNFIIPHINPSCSYVSFCDWWFQQFLFQGVRC